MEQVQRRFVTFDIGSLTIHSITWEEVVKDNHRSLPCQNNDIVLPFFNITKRIHEYYPIIENDMVIGFRRKGIYENQFVLETEENVLRGIRSYENFITKCRILCEHSEQGITLRYDPNFFSEFDNIENLDRLKLAKETVYNVYITQKGDPYNIYESYEISLNPFLDNQTITLPFKGSKDTSVYVVTKNK